MAFPFVNPTVRMRAVINTVEMISDKAEHENLLAAFEDIRSGRVRSLDEIEAELMYLLKRETL